MNRTQHIAGGFSFWLMAIIGYFFTLNRGPRGQDWIWIVASLIMGLAGATAPDFDLAFDNILPHRNAFTHSIFLPGLLCLPLYFVRDEARLTYFVPIYAMFLVGNASHLILDLSPKTWQGSALIHIWWKNKEGKKYLGEKKSIIWLFVNAFLLTGLAVIFLFFFINWAS